MGLLLGRGTLVRARNRAGKTVDGIEYGRPEDLGEVTEDELLNEYEHHRSHGATGEYDEYLCLECGYKFFNYVG